MAYDLLLVKNQNFRQSFMSIVNWLERLPQQTFFSLAGRAVSLFAVAAVLLCAAGLYFGFVSEPISAWPKWDYHILFLHVPAACMTLIMYLVLVFWTVLGLLLNTRLPAMMASAVAPTGATFALLALWTGALWSKSTSGLWWTWSALSVAELILLFLYLIIMALHAAAENARWADRAVVALVLGGMVNMPLLYYSHDWQGILHQAVSFGMHETSPAASIVLPLMLGFWAYAFVAPLMRVRCIMLERERHADWATDFAKGRL